MEVKLHFPSGNLCFTTSNIVLYKASSVYTSCDAGDVMHKYDSTEDLDKLLVMMNKLPTEQHKRLNNDKKFIFHQT